MEEPPSFDQAAAVADKVLAVDGEQVNVVFNSLKALFHTTPDGSTAQILRPSRGQS